MAMVKVKACDFCGREIKDDLNAVIMVNRSKKGDVCEKCLQKITKKENKKEMKVQIEPKVETLKPLRED